MSQDEPGAGGPGPTDGVPPILVVGSVALDSVATPERRVRDVLGGSASYFSLVASLLAPVRVVGVVGEDFPESCRRTLSRRSIDLTGLVTEEGKTFRWSGEYDPDLVGRRTLRTELNVFESFQPKIPQSYRSTPLVFLANIDPDLQASVLDQMSDPQWVFLDTMDFWMEGAKRQSLIGLLDRVDAVLIDHVEARLLSGQSHLQDAVQWIRDRGPKIVVIKRGDCGALARLEDEWFWVPPYPESAVQDPTGAGDSFAGGVLGAMARWGTSGSGLRRALLVGAAAASCAIEAFGAEPIAELSPDEVFRREAVLRRMTEVSEGDPATVARPPAVRSGGA